MELQMQQLKVKEIPMPKKKLNFEQSLDKLEDIVYKMETEELDIDKSINLYKEGIELAVSCNESLKNYEKEIFVLKQTSEKIFTEESFTKID